MQLSESLLFCNKPNSYLLSVLYYVMLCYVIYLFILSNRRMGRDDVELHTMEYY